MPLPTAEYLSQAVQDAIQAMSATSERSLLSLTNHLGVSDVGHCREYARRTIVGEPFSDARDKLTAWLGTAVGDHFEQAFARKFSNAQRHVEVAVRVKGARHEYVLTGHPDILLPDGIIDGKSKNGLAGARKNGSTLQEKFQLHLYALGAWQMGLFREGLALEDVWVANVWIDRSGADKTVHSNPQKFDPIVLSQAADWLDDVQYAVENKEEASRDKHIEWCADYCERYTLCRLGERDTGRIITAPHLVDAVRLVREGRELKKVGTAMEEEGKAALLDVAKPGHEGPAGTVDDIPVRVTWVNSSATRSGHHRINIG